MAEDPPNPELIELLVVALIPIFSVLGTIIAEEIYKWSKKGYPLPKLW